MKSKYLIPVIVLVTITLTSAQQNKTSVTKEETQEWISEKIRQYSNGQTNRYGISFKDENMFIEQNTSIKLSQGTQELHGIKRVPIKSIESISFSDNESVYFMTINMKDGANVIMTEFDGLSPEYKAYTQIVLPKNIDNEGLKERLVKAFNHLVEIYTGKIKKEPF